MLCTIFGWRNHRDARTHILVLVFHLVFDIFPHLSIRAYILKSCVVCSQQTQSRQHRKKRGEHTQRNVTQQIATIERNSAEERNASVCFILLELCSVSSGSWVVHTECSNDNCIPRQWHNGIMRHACCFVQLHWMTHMHTHTGPSIEIDKTTLPPRAAKGCSG